MRSSRPTKNREHLQREGPGSLRSGQQHMRRGFASSGRNSPYSSAADMINVIVSDDLLLQGSYSEAELMCREALRIYDVATGKKHEKYALCLGNLASLLGDQVGAQGMLRCCAKTRLQGKYRECEPMAREALRILEKVVGKEHEHYATCLTNLASLLRARVGAQCLLSLVVLRSM